MTVEQTKLIEDNIGLVRSTISKNYPKLIHDEDVYQVACLGLIKAARLYDPATYKFSTYAVQGIKFMIGHYFTAKNTYKRKSENFNESLYSPIPGTNLCYADSISISDFSSDTAFEVSLEEAYRELAESDKTILTMRLEGYTFDAIGQSLGMTKQNVQHRINSRIKPVLRTILGVAS